MSRLEHSNPGKEPGPEPAPVEGLVLLSSLAEQAQNREGLPDDVCGQPLTGEDPGQASPLSIGPPRPPGAEQHKDPQPERRFERSLREGRKSIRVVAVKERVRNHQHHQVGTHDQEVCAYGRPRIDHIGDPIDPFGRPRENEEDDEPGHEEGHVNYERPADELENEARGKASLPGPGSRDGERRDRDQHQTEGVIRLEKEREGPGIPKGAGEISGSRQEKKSAQGRERSLGV